MRTTSILLSLCFLCLATTAAAAAEIQIKAGCTNTTSDYGIIVTSSGAADAEHRFSVTHKGAEVFSDKVLGTVNCDETYVTDKMIIVTHGARKDRITFYGVLSNGKMRRASFQIADNPISYRLWDNEFIARYGQQKDRSTRFCFQAGLWSRSAGQSVKSPTTPRCSGSSPSQGDPLGGNSVYIEQRTVP